MGIQRNTFTVYDVYFHIRETVGFHRSIFEMGPNPTYINHLHLSFARSLKLIPADSGLMAGFILDNNLTFMSVGGRQSTQR